MSWSVLLCSVFLWTYDAPPSQHCHCHLPVFFLSDLEILMAVFFTHISSGHKKWLNYVNWEVIRLGRHGRCTGIALHCVVITVHLSTWFWNHEREDSVHCVVVSFRLSSRQDPAHNFNFSLPKFSFPVLFSFHFAFDQTFSTEHPNILPLPFTPAIECCPKSWSCESCVLTDVGSILLPSVLLGTHAGFSFPFSPAAPDNPW